MKKYLSLFLTFAMLLSMVPAATATEPVATEVPEIAAEEIISVVPEQPSEEPPHPPVEMDERVYFEVTPEVAELDASYITISGTVTLPQPATQDSDLRVIAIASPATDSNGRVFSDPLNGSYGDYVEVLAGQRSVSYSLTLPAGSYALGVDNSVPGSGTYLGNTYFNADGSVTFNQYTAVRKNYTSNSVVNLTMPKGEYTINGTLNFSSPAPADSEIRIGLGQNGRNSNWYYQDLLVKKGQTSLDYSFAVAEGSYYIEFYSDFTEEWLYADLYGDLSSDWDTHVYLPCFGENTTVELTHNGDDLLGEAQEDVGPSTATTVQITVNLPAAVEKRTEFRTLLISDTGSSRTAYTYVDPGTSYYTVSMSNPYDSFTVCYADVTDCYNYYSYEYCANNRYVTEGGITSDIENAQYFSKDTTRVTINDSSNYALKGTLKLDAPRYYESSMYVVAEFKDGSRYAGRVFFDADDTQCSYAIYVPTRHYGNNYTLWAADTYNANSNRILESSYYAGGNYTITGNASLGTLTIPAPPITLTGTFALPDGMTAPAGGLAVEIDFDYETSAIYLLPEGKNSFQYALSPIVEQNNNNYYSLCAYIINGPDDLCSEMSIHNRFVFLNDMTLQAQRAVTVSGFITVPNECKDKGSTINLYSESNIYDQDLELNYNYRENTYITVLPGETRAPFSVKAPIGDDVRVYASVDNDATGKLPANDLYLQHDGSTDSSNSSISLYKDLSDVVFAYVKGKTVSGTITAAIPGEYYGNVYLVATKTGKEYYTNVRFEGTQGTYSLSVPQNDNSANYLLYIYMHSGPDGALLDTDLYWTPDGMTTVEDTSNAFSVPADGMTADFSIPKAKSVSGSVLIGSDLPADAYYAGRVIIITDGAEYEAYFNNEDDRMSYSVNLPSDYEGTCKLAVYCYRNDNAPATLPPYVNMYLTEDGTLSADPNAAKNFAIPADGLNQNITLHPGRSFSITLNAPAGFSGDYSVRLYLENLDTNSSTSQQLNFSGTSGSVAYTVPYGSANYGLEIYVSSGPGVMSKYYYYNNGVWSTDSDSMTAIPMDSDNLTLSLPAGKTITGKLVSSDGTPVNLGTSPNNGRLGYISFSSINGPYLDYTSTVNADGTFSVTIPDDATGTHCLYFSPYSTLGGNVITSRTYYYVENATASTTNSNDATPIDVSGTIPELTIIVDTGYTLRGTAKLGEGAFINSTADEGDYIGDFAIRLRENVDSDSFYAYSSISLYKGSTSWEYSMVVPKKNTTYTLSLCDFRPNDSVTHNIYTGEMVISDSLSVSGNTTLPEAVLSKAKAAIDVTVNSDTLGSSEEVSFNLYLIAGDNIYEVYEWIRSGDTVTITVPPSETSSSYKLYYELYSDAGLDRGPIYVGANGVLTKNEAEAASFPWTTTNHTLNMLEIPPFLAGKIYLPGYTDQICDIVLSGWGDNEYIPVTPYTVKTDTNGNKYVEYSLSETFMHAWDTYYVECDVDYNMDVAPENRLWASNYFINPDGAFTTDWTLVEDFTVPSNTTTILDFALADWETVSSNCVLQSSHNIVPSDDPVTYTYTFVYPGITRSTYTTIFFNALTDVDLIINGETFFHDSRYKRHNFYTDDGIITIEMTVSSDEYYDDCYYGFGIDKISVSSSYVDTSTGSGWVYSLSGVSEEAVMSDLNKGKTIYIAQVAPYDTVASTYAAIYNSNGKLLDIVVIPMDFSDSTTDCVPVSFDTGYADAAYLKVMLLGDSYFAPLNINNTISR